MRLRVSKSSLILFFILLVVVILHYSGSLRPPEIWLMKVLNPLGSEIYRFGQKIQILWEGDVSSSDYANLQEERNRLIAKNVELQILEQENQELREALNFTKENQYNILVANVVGRDPVLLNHFILNKGTSDGIKNNFPVTSPAGILVGKIIKAEDKVSVMLIPTDTNFQTAALVFGKSKGNTTGLVRGEKGLGVKMEFIPQDEVINKDDIVVTSGLELNMPKGLVIGKVSEVRREAKGVFGEAIINPLVAYEDLNIVMVLLPN